MKTKNTKLDIAFILLPPSSTAIPSPAFSSLKGFLNSCGINSEVIYGNHLLEIENDFFKEENTSETEAILPFIYLLDNINPEKTEYIKTFFKSFWPDLFLLDRSLENDWYEEIKNKYTSFIQSIIDRINNEDIKIIGFTSKFYQWVPATIVAKYIKCACPNVKIISGGWTNSSSALNFMNLNTHFDYAMWGEGEIPLKLLINYIIDKKNNFSNNPIPRIVYRTADGKLHKSSTGNINSYVNFENEYFNLNFDDYFQSAKVIKQNDFLVPIERGRGCNWNKCTFCYLSQGYMFRTKSNERLITELKFLIQKYNISNFFFTDNDVIGSDIIYFNKLLDRLIELKKQHPEFKIKMAEIISKDVDFNTILKMKEAGFENVQIGLEAISEKLLADINKKQSTMDNFFFIKSAEACGITVKGANIIIDTPNETDEMIIESINNLHYYRFLLANQQFEFKIIPLCVANFSKYLKMIKERNEEKDWSISELNLLLSNDYMDKIDRFSLLDFVLNKAEKPLWNSFNRVLSYYKRKKFNYNIKINEKNKCIIYKEYTNKKLVKDIIFDEEIYLYILKELNVQIIHQAELLERLKTIGFVNDTYNQRCIQELVKQDIIILDSYGFMTSIISI